MFHMIVNANSIVQHVIQIKNGIMINVNSSVKSVIPAKKISTCLCENSKYLKTIVDDK